MTTYRGLIISKTTHRIENVVQCDTDIQWTPPEGCIGVRFDGPAGPGWTWDGTTAIPPPAPVPVRTTAELISRAWAATDAACRAGADENSRARYLAWLIDPATSAAKREKILAVQAWMDALWLAYAAYRANPVGDFVLPAVACPWSFWDVAGTA
jgi:hypothetical protein